ncbi:MAG: PEP-CTERM sorting domain-containing protein [Akkermansiaceae bacterium]
MKTYLKKSLLAAVVLGAGTLVAQSATLTVGDYTTEVSGHGSYSSEALSEKRASGTYTSSIVAAFASPTANAQGSAYAEAESTLHVTGGTPESEVMVTIHFAYETFGNKSLENSISSANSLIDITDNAAPETIIWESELDLHLTGTNTTGSQGDIDNTLTATIALKSGHTYTVAVESFAEATAFVTDDGNGGHILGWARAEAETDPTFTVDGPNPQGYSLNHVVGAGSSAQTVPEPSAVTLLGLGTLGFVLRRKK